ncbi:integrase core domain-containing protein, partial [Burkholderia gladioli]|uniref:integrase core domain-containing protein n=1 Tax=Burkholderia gladioli TaxID=28095 RepID=UPI002FE3856D
MAFGLRGICSPWDKNMPRTQNYGQARHARRFLDEYIDLYNRKRPHSSLADQTPDEAYFATLPAIKSAA